MSLRDGFLIAGKMPATRFNHGQDAHATVVAIVLCDDRRDDGAVDDLALDGDGDVIEGQLEACAGQGISGELGEA